MQLQKATRKNVKIKMALQGPAGAGKTYSALLLAQGLVSDGDLSKVAVIDTEQSACLYVNLGDFNVLPLEPKFSPERFTRAISVCEEANMEVIVIDSLSAEWEGSGGILDIHSKMTGNSFMNWNLLTPRHNALIQKILNSSCHIICTIRSKQDYVISDRNGKKVPEKVGLKGIQRDNLDFEFTLVLTLDMNHQASVSKDRTNLFTGKPSFLITNETGKLIRDWCNSGISVEQVRDKIKACQSIEQLTQVFNQYKCWYNQLESDFKQKKNAINIITKHTNKKINANGITKN